MNKRGLSEVVTTMFIVLISVVAIIIIWVAVRPLFQNTSDKISSDCITLNLEMTQCTIDTTSGSESVSVTVNRKVGQGDLKAIKFIFDGPGGVKKIADNDTSLGELDSATFLFSTTSEDLAGLEGEYTVNAAPLVGVKKNLCNPLSTPIACN